MDREDNITFYVVEDDQTDFEHIDRAIHEIQPAIKIRRFLHGAVLLAHLQSIPPGEYPSLIMLDFYMPVLDGLKTLQRLKANENFQQIPVVMWSGSSLPEDISQAYHLGARAFHTKPVLFEDWQEQLQTTLRYWLKTVELPHLAEYRA